MNNQRTTASPSSRSPRAGSGFTLIELLVVMLVITLLLAIGIPVIWAIKTQVKTHATQAAITQIDNAVAGYYGLHNKYPLAQEMVGKLIGQSFTIGSSVATAVEVDDNQPGLGYRLQPRGTLYPPWCGVDELPRSGDYVEDGQSDQVHFIDSFGHYIWYCPFDTETLTYTDEEFDKDDSEDGVTINSIADYARDASGKYFRRDYIIMSQGANAKWGLFSNTGGTSGTSAIPTDDITNFTKE